MHLERLQSLLETFPRLNIALLGDLFLDRYLELVPDVQESSIETGLEAYQVERVRNSPGALGTVINNLAALGVGRLTPVSVIGDDGHGFDLLACLRHIPAVDQQFILSAKDRLTPTYTKPLRPKDEQWSELNRLDVRSRTPLTDSLSSQLQEKLQAAFNECDGLIVLDQVAETNCGVVNRDIQALLAQLGRAHRDKLILVDSRIHLPHFSDVTLKGNEQEFCRASGQPTASAAASLLATRSGRTAFCTVGAEGTLVADPNGAVETVAGFPVAGPVDIVGAGDSATSGMAAALLSGASAREAAEIGNLVASITVQQLGTTGTATPRQVVSRFGDLNKS